MGSIDLRHSQLLNRLGHCAVSIGREFVRDYFRDQLRLTLHL